MATIYNFEDLKIWQKARLLNAEIFYLIGEGNFAKDYALKDQINRSSGSIMDNIAEGFGRMSKNEFVQFLTYSYGSALECKSQIYRAMDRDYLTQEKSAEILLLLEEIKKMNNSLIQYLGKTDIRGQKYKARDAETK